MANRAIYCDRTLCRLEMLNRAVQSYQKICVGNQTKQNGYCLFEKDILYIWADATFI